MGIARSTYYDAPARAGDDTALVEAMQAVKDEFEAYGWRRMQAALAQQGWTVNHKKLKRLMREHGLNARPRRRYVATTDSRHDQPIYPDCSRELVLTGPNQLWPYGDARIAYRLTGRRFDLRCDRRRLRLRRLNHGRLVAPDRRLCYQSAY